MTCRTSSRLGGVGRGLLGTALLCVTLGVCATPSFAAPRDYDSQITGFNHPEAVTVGPNDEVWVSDVQNGVISKYDAYPSQTKIGEQTSGGKVWGGSYQARSVAASAANDFLYVGVDTEEGAVCGGTSYGIFDNFGDIYEKAQPDYEIYGSACQMWFAVDNAPQSDSYGRYYLFTGQAPSILSVYDGYGHPVNFTGSASYIKGNQITGTPKGQFPSEAAGSFSPSYSGVAVDPNTGNLWVINNDGYYGETEIDEYAPSGIFLQRITAKGSGVPPNSTPASKPPAFGGGPGLSGIAVDPTNGNVLVSDRAGLVIDEFSPQGQYLGHLTGADTPAGGFAYECQEIFGNPENKVCMDRAVGIAVNSQGYVYVTDGDNAVVDIFKPAAIQPTIESKPDTNPTATSGTLNAVVDPNGGGDVTSCHVDFGTDTEFQTGEYKLGPIPCTPDPSGTHFSAPTEVHADALGLSTETTYHYRFVFSNANATRVGPDHTYTPHKVLGLRADPATAITGSGATLHGSFVGNGALTHYWFEYGPTTAYGTKAPLPAPPGGNAGSAPGPGRTSEELSIGGLEPVTRYHYRIVAENGSTSASDDQSFRTKAVLPQSKGSVTDVHSNQVVLNAHVNPGGSDTTYNFEYGTEKCSEVPDPCTTAFLDTHIGMNLTYDDASRHLAGLEAGTTYYYRIIATNSIGTTYSADRTFSTFPFAAEINDPCSNVLARQQTGAALLTDCRAYELVSSSHAGGYDVESTLVPGQTPFDGFPRAESPLRVLYGVHNGALPGVAGEPTNRGVDPYVATRGKEGWTTSYVGIPANNPNAAAPFSSTLAEANSTLDTFAFGGPDICSPCFADGSTGVPLHLPDGSLVQGMHGFNAQPGAEDEGVVRKRFSADGKHFVFGSTALFEAAGDAGGSIYDRNLSTNTTQVVSTLPGGATMTGGGVGELDISSDGSHIVVGKHISTDADGNEYWHLYMHIGSTASSSDLTSGATAGALYDGMTADGSRVFLTTTDHLLGTDTDASADIYEAAVSGGGTVTLRLVTTKGGVASNDDSCTPPGFPNSWNDVSGEGKCGAVAFAGGAGVAAGNGTFYFVSPELLDGAAQADGEEDQPNLYVVKPGSNPEFVATIDTSVGKPAPQPVGHPRLSGSFVSKRAYPESLAVDQSTGGAHAGDVYVAERETESVSRFHPNGSPDPFTAGPNQGSNTLTSQYLGYGGEGEIAVDSAPSSPFDGDLYISSAIGVRIFASSGAQVGELNGFGDACGVAVDQSNGAVYVGDYQGAVWRFAPKPGSTPPITGTSYDKTGIHTEGLSPCPVGTDSSGHVFALGYFGGPLREYDDSEFEASAPKLPGTEVNVSPAYRIYTDPANDDRYVDSGGKIVWLNAANEVQGEFGAGELDQFRQGVAINGTTKHVYVSNQESGEIIEYGYNDGSFHPITHPAVLHAVQQAGTHSYGDFQVTPEGDYAAFTTRQPLDPSFDNLEHSEVYRYDVAHQALACVSCPPTNALATGDANLASNGLSLTDDGRMFFDSNDPIVLRDGDGRKDVYEWEVQGAGNCQPENPNFFPTGICLGLISSGTSPFDSSLLSASADGTDAFFFTHDTLVHEDENGPITKLYDARTDGGVFEVPPPAKCAASDECHGPGTKESEPAKIRTEAGTPGNPESKPCRKGFVRKHGKCVRKKHKRHYHRRQRR